VRTSFFIFMVFSQCSLQNIWLFSATRYAAPFRAITWASLGASLIEN
jgi:hypothetical protein